MSEFRINKERRGATLMLSDGRQVRGSFFVGASAVGPGVPERVKDLLNNPSSFFPFEVFDGTVGHTGLFNRDQVVFVTLAT